MEDTMGRKTQWSMLVVVAVALSGALVGCGDDDGGSGAGGAAGTAGTGGAGTGGTGGTAGTGGTGGGEVATTVGRACTMDSECDGTTPDCLSEIDIAAPFGTMVPQEQRPAPIATPGGYCTSTGCTTQAECGQGAGCYDLATVTEALIGFMLPAQFNMPGVCLDTCTAPSECTRSGYTCRPSFEINTGDYDAGALADLDAGFELPETITGPSYCLPELVTQ